MSPGYTLPRARVRSDLEAFLDDGGDINSLDRFALAQEVKFDGLQNRHREVGEIWRTVVDCALSPHYPYRIYTLKVGDGEYRYGHKPEELEHLRMLKNL